ncbi:uncharacterized protein K452DRAFT_346847 [Aplosporella prunicola CBS 121167]|uniref:Uncharacterized protein n=1 Tax=Aplosporella prunicola CBS 121167 TaxID=1176127 RepID=A0A6A6BG42_9PEZI|nr:uncharacterized protein K452DRAFT_346847 [Aplosporella prunicola CBS 121167]KAF2143122.1 hypothetical protein K452DRAFT_346847 [Aplosporella prunicola CBS 121167]
MLFKSPKEAGSKFGFALVATAFATLLFPLIKVVAAGLFHDSTSTTSALVALQLDSSLVENLWLLDYHFDNRPYVEWASQLAEWTITPDLNVAERPGILDNLVISNLTEWSPTTAAASNKTTGYEIEARVPALAVDVACEPISPHEFEVFAFRNNDCNDTISFDFRWSSSHCLSTLNITEANQISHGINTFLENEFFFSSQCSKGAPPSYYGSCHMDVFGTTSTIVVFLEDFSSISGPFEAITEFKNNTIVNSDTFNVSVPTLRGLSCKENITTVEVNVKFKQPTSLDISGNITSLPWTPVSYNRESITHITGVNTTGRFPMYMAPKSSTTSNSMGANLLAMLNSSSLWPTTTSSSNFFELLAAYAEYKLNNHTALLDVNDLAKAAEEMYVAVTRELLTERRSFALDIANATNTKNMTGTMRHHQTRTKQDLRTTIILEVLTTVLFCLLWIMFRFPSRSILPKAPDSIAARLSFLANSALVRHLKEENISSIKKTDIWKEKTGLGWWPIQDRSNHEHPITWRWGIDVGPNMVQRKWNKPPSENASSEFSNGEETSDPSLSHHGILPNEPTSPRSWTSGFYDRIPQEEAGNMRGSSSIDDPESRRSRISGRASNESLESSQNLHNTDVPRHETPQILQLSPVSPILLSQFPLQRRYTEQEQERREG